MRAAAEALIQQGLKLRREGKPEEALQRFRQAHEMAPSPRTYGQMGLVETTLKRWTDGETHLAVALANPDDAWVRKNRAFLDQALSLCREHVGDLVITGPARRRSLRRWHAGRHASGCPRVARRRGDRRSDRNGVGL